MHVPLDGVEELRESPELQSAASPEDAYDRQWAMDMVGNAVAALREDYERRDRGAWFDLLRAALPGGGQLQPYAELALQLGAREGAIKKAVFDLRNAFAERTGLIVYNETAPEALGDLIAAIRGNA